MGTSSLRQLDTDNLDTTEVVFDGFSCFFHYIVAEAECLGVVFAQVPCAIIRIKAVKVIVCKVFIQLSGFLKVLAFKFFGFFCRKDTPVVQMVNAIFFNDTWCISCQYIPLVRADEGRYDFGL